MKSFLLGEQRGIFVSLVTCSMLLVALGAGSWIAAGCGESCADYDTTFDQAWWLSWGLHFDPGTQTGIPANDGPKQKWVAVSFSIMGFILNLVFLGFIVENCRVILETWRIRHYRIVENGHTVVLGWTDKTLFLLGELAEMLTDSVKGGGTIVVLGEPERPEPMHESSS